MNYFHLLFPSSFHKIPLVWYGLLEKSPELFKPYNIDNHFFSKYSEQFYHSYRLVRQFDYSNKVHWFQQQHTHLPLYLDDFIMVLVVLSILQWLHCCKTPHVSNFLIIFEIADLECIVLPSKATMNEFIVSWIDWPPKYHFIIRIFLVNWT